MKPAESCVIEQHTVRSAKWSETSTSWTTLEAARGLPSARGRAAEWELCGTRVCLKCDGWIAATRPEGGWQGCLRWVWTIP